MSTTTKPIVLNGNHTAGIFADMTVDGPVIGTLVAVVDRAKNLPNRKTIGKQDPYCAARLGKEAKKTTTDVRGGQTPKWDQELRFTVHDSPDYYQLKISVFTDDKKTDLIGEAWIDLKSIIVQGGGQSDLWQTLACRGKYAGEIRVEITFYDTRPRPERPAPKQRQQNPIEQDASGSMKQRTGPVKRRPLPSDPVTGEAPPPPIAPGPVASQPELHQTPPSRSHHKTASHSGLIPHQSPLQAVEYNTPPPLQGARQPMDHYSPSSHSAHRQVHRSRESLGTPSRYQEDRGYSQRGQRQATPYDQPDPRVSHESLSELPEFPDAGEASLPFEMDTPPPPPAHRSRQNSAPPEGAHRASFDLSPQKSMIPMRRDVLENEAHRHSISAYPGQPVFKPYDPSGPVPIPMTSRNETPYESPTSSSRYHSHSRGYSAHQRSMQPTVEEVADSPTTTYRHDRHRATYHGDYGHENTQSPMSQVLSRSPGASQHYMSQSPPSYAAREREHQDQGVYNSPSYNMRERDYTGHDAPPASVSPLSTVDHSNNSSLVSYSPQAGQQQRSVQGIDDYEPSHSQRRSGYGMPDVPLSLSPGVDLALSQEFADRTHENRGNDHPYAGQVVTTPTRGRHRSEGPPSYTNSPHSYAAQSYEGRSVVTYSSRQDPPPVRKRTSVSPNPNAQHHIRRKSVSPAPSPAENRRLSDVPFGPDSYDAFNPSAASPVAAQSRGGSADPNAKIIAHDGREIDPSDHLPMDTWAPEPEAKPSQKQASPEPHARPSPSGAQPMPPSGRRQLRIAPRTDSLMAQQPPPPPPSYSHVEDPRTPPASGRNRLQKKAPRGSPGHSPSLPSPLAPISPDNYQERTTPYAPSHVMHRGGSYDYPNENHTPAPFYGSGPPIPAKIPLPIMSGANGGAGSLMEEMQRIDIGDGRSRRRGGY